MGWAYWANYLSVQLSSNILLGPSKYWLKNGHVELVMINECCFFFIKLMSVVLNALATMS